MAKKQSKKTSPGLSQGEMLAPTKTQGMPSIKAQGKPGGFSVNLKLTLLLGIISCIVYANTLKNGYVYDDISAITKNTIVKKGISAIPELLSTPYRRGFYATSNDLYRPLSLIMFAVEYQIFGLNPLPYHLINIIIFAFCVILLFLFFDEFFEGNNKAVAFISALLFALHPIHTEVVANIKSRDELLCFFFAFLCLIQFLRYYRSDKVSYLILGLVSLFLAMLSKETVVTYLIIVPLIFMLYYNENRKRGIVITITSIIGIAACILIRFVVLKAYHADEPSSISFIDNPLASDNLSFESRIATAILILGYYIKLLFIPNPLVCDYSFNSIPFSHFSDPVVLVSLTIYVFLIFYGLKRLIKNHRDPYAFGILFFLITISLFSNILIPIGTMMGERLLFFPSVGFCLVAALLIEKLAKKSAGMEKKVLINKIGLAFILPISLVYAFLAIERNREWFDNYTLYKTDLEKAPEDTRLNYYLGTEIELEEIADTTNINTVKQKQNLNEAILYLKKSEAIYPDFGSCQMSLWNAYFMSREYDSAITHLKKAIKIDPTLNKYTLFPDSKLQADIGDAYFHIHQYDSAEVHDRMAIVINPNNPDALNNLAAIYNIKKEFLQAIEIFKKAIAISSNSLNLASYHYNIGCSYLNLKQTDSAVYHFAKTLELNPSLNDANLQSGIAYFQAKQYPLAILFFKKTLAINHGEVNAAENIALTYKITGQTDSSKIYEIVANDIIRGAIK